MGSHYEAPIRKPLVTGNKSYHQISVDVARPIEGVANKKWWIVFGISVILFMWGIGCIIYTISTGIGVWGLNKTVGWAWDITNFVWWIGIGHAGTLISAVLLLFRQKWRMGINRSAEAMTIFSVIQAGLFPVIHMGRPWLAYWIVPIPNQFGSLWVGERLGKLIRTGEQMKTPVLAAIGAKDAEQNAVSPRTRRDDDLGVTALADLLTASKMANSVPAACLGLNRLGVPLRCIWPTPRLFV